MKNISHPNIINIVDSYISEDEYFKYHFKIFYGGSL